MTMPCPWGRNCPHPARWRITADNGPTHWAAVTCDNHIYLAVNKARKAVGYAVEPTHEALPAEIQAPPDALFEPGGAP